MKKYRKLPLVVEAFQWFPGVLNEIVEFHEKMMVDGSERGIVKSSKGDFFVEPGDWVIRGIDGEYYPCSNKIFKLSYEPYDECKAALHELKDNEKHVRDPRHQIYSICGAPLLGLDFCFTSIDHLFLSLKGESRLVACPKCLIKIKYYLDMKNLE